MTVAAPTGRAIFYGNGSRGPFYFNFPFFEDGWITAVKASETMGLTELAQGFDFTVSGAGSPNGGSVTLANPLADGETLYIRRVIPLTQPVEFGTFGAFFASTHEEAFDRSAMMVQQVDERVGDLEERLSSMTMGVQLVVASGSSSTAQVLSIDATLASVELDLSGQTDVIVIKEDATENTVIVIDTSGATVCRGSLEPLSVQDETVHLRLIAGDWKKI